MTHQHNRTTYVAGLDQGNAISPAGRRVIDCAGYAGTVTNGPHCSYGVTVAYDHGPTFYTDTQCLWNACNTPGCHRLARYHLIASNGPLRLCSFCRLSVTVGHQVPVLLISGDYPTT
jgi:hypothetical protein